MSQYKDIAVGSTAYFWFAANLTTGAAGDGATPLYDVRLAGASSSGAPTASGTPTLLTHANYTDGLHEIAIDTTGYAAGEYAVFCTLTISTVNPAGFCGSFVVRAASSTLYDFVSAIKTKTDALPTDPADESSIQSSLTTIAGYLDTEIAAIKAKTDNLPASPAAVGSAMTLATDAVTAAALAADAITEIQAGLATAAALSTVQADTDNIQTRIPAALVSGRMDSSTGAMATDVLTAASLNADAVTEIQSGLATAAALDTVDNFLDTEMGAVKAVTDKLDTALELDGAVYRYTTNALEQSPAGGSAPTAADIADAVWDEALAGHLSGGSTGASLNGAGAAGDPWTASLPGAYGSGTAGFLIGNNMDAPVSAVPTAAEIRTELSTELARIDVATSTRLDTASYTAPATPSAIADQVWDEVLAGHLTAGTTGAGLNAAGGAGDPWATAIPGAYGSGTAGKILGDNINATIASRSSQSTLDTLDDFVDTEVLAIKAKTDLIPAAPAAVGDIPSAAAITTAVWGAGTRTLTTFGTLIADIWAAVADSAGVTTLLSRLTSQRATNLDNLNAQVSLTALQSTVTALSIPTANQNADALLDRADGIETDWTLRQAVRVALSSIAGKLSGAATAAVVIRNVTDAKPRITATVDVDGNRTAVTYDKT